MAGIAEAETERAVAVSCTAGAVAGTLEIEVEFAEVSRRDGRRARAHLSRAVRSGEFAARLREAGVSGEFEPRHG